jgi:hypothetical protein
VARTGVAIVVEPVQSLQGIEAIIGLQRTCSSEVRTATVVGFNRAFFIVLMLYLE